MVIMVYSLFWVINAGFISSTVLLIVRALDPLRTELSGPWKPRVGLKSSVPFGVLVIRVPYYIGDPKRDPNLENYPYLGLKPSDHGPRASTALRCASRRS